MSDNKDNVAVECLTNEGLRCTYENGLEIYDYTEVLQPDGIELPEEDRWFVIYPRYLNSCFPLKMGRRTTKKNSVANPTIAEIATAIVTLFPSLNVALESKSRYPRSTISEDEIGRVRVCLKDAKGNYLPGAPTKSFLLRQIAVMIIISRTRNADIKKSFASKDVGKAKQTSQSNSQSKSDKKKKH